MNDFRELIGSELPIIQAPMAGVQGSALAIAVSSAGGLGSLPCAMLSPEQMRAEIAAIRASTSAPFGVNFFCHTPPRFDPARDRAWRALLAPYYEEFEVPEGERFKPGAQRASFGAEAAAVVEQLKPPIVSFHFGLPEDSLFMRVKAAACKVLGCATTVDEARWLAARGVDGIIVQGIEAGGHRGMFLSRDLNTQAGTLALVRQVVKAVNVPAIAAGGIADAPGVRAALDLGAVAAQVGTSYLLCPEASTSQVYRAALRSDEVRHTALTNLFSGAPARGIVNRLMRELGPINPAAPDFPLAAAALAPIRERAEARGDSGFSPLWCGQNPGGCAEISAAELTRRLAG